MKMCLPAIIPVVAAALFLTFALFGAEKKNEKDTGEKRKRDVDAPVDYAGRAQLDVAYKTTPGKTLLLDIFYPADTAAQFPTLVYYHGGGWRNGSKESIRNKLFRGVLDGLTKNGVAVAAVSYRLLGDGVFFGEIHSDTVDALRYLVKNSARLKIDPDRIAVMGASAGAELALVSGLAPAKTFIGDEKLADVVFEVKAIVSWYGTTNFDTGGPNKFLETVIGKEKAGIAAERKKYSAVEYVSRRMPPVLLVHGEDDKVVRIGQSEDFHKKAVAAGADVKLIRVPGAGHMFMTADRKVTDQMDEITAATVGFVVEKLRAVPQKKP